MISAEPSSASSVLMSLSDVARLARVQRPVVSMWRRRSAGSAEPFPLPVAIDRGQQLFNADQVAEWLASTGRGNNPNTRAEAFVFARFDRGASGDDDSFQAVTALLALRAAAGRKLGELDADDLVDLADEVDPDDSCLFREIETLDDAAPLARFVDVLVDGAYGAGAAFESVMANRFREGRRELTRTALEPAALALAAAAALELARTNPASDPEAPIAADPTGVGGDLLVAIAAAAEDRLDLTVRTSGATGRLLRRRLLAHGVVCAAMPADGHTLDGAVHVAHFPTHEAETTEEMLAALDALLLDFDDRQRAVVVAPAAVLCEGGLAGEAALLRNDALRTGRVRAIVRLPRGLVTANPRQALALWALGPAQSQVAVGERWTVMADLQDEGLTEATRADLVGDLSAAMGDPRQVRAHAFRFARFARTSALLARSGSLFSDPPARSQDDAAGLAARLDDALASLDREFPFSFAPSPNDVPPLSTATLRSLVEQRQLRCLPGTKLRSDEPGTGTGFTVIGRDELNGASLGVRTVDRLEFAERHPNARLTEPGDVVFIAGPRPRALVDVHGSAVVASPARILRITREGAPALTPEVLAADVAGARSTDWRRWHVRRVRRDQHGALRTALAEIRSARHDLEQQLARLHELQNLVTDAVADGAVSLMEGTS